MGKGLDKLIMTMQTKRADQLRRPICQAEGCKRRVSVFVDGTFTTYCYEHRTADEWDAYERAYKQGRGAAMSKNNSSAEGMVQKWVTN